MAPANIDLVRSIYAGWDRGDYSAVDWAHPEIEFVMAADTATPGSSIGRAGMAEAWRGWLSVWEEFHNEAYEYRELDDERILVLTYFAGRGKVSGVNVGEVRTRGASLFHVHEGLVTKLVVYSDADRALADLGLSSEAETGP